MNKYNNIVDKILTIIDEDKNQPERILKYDLDKMLDSEISNLIQDAYDDGYTVGRNDPI